MHSEWKGHYFDGKSAVKNDVTVTLDEKHIVIKFQDKTLKWNHDLCRIVDDIAIDNYSRIEYLDDKNQKLVVYDPDFLKLLSSKADFKKRFTRKSLSSSKLKRYALTGLVLILLILPFTYFFLLPQFSEFIARNMPVWAEKRLAENYYNLLAPKESRCNDEEKLLKLDSVMKRLLEKENDSRYEFNFTVVKSDIVNAFALPGGSVVFYSGLINKTENPEQFAGVMAHELQHVLNRHGTKAMVNQFSLNILIGALTGFNSSGNSAIEALKLLGQFKYSRDFEQQADTEGVRMMADVGINPKGMAGFFQILKKEVGDVPDYLKYFSTHPQTDSRIENLELLAEKFETKPVELFSEKEWEDIKNICKESSVKEFTGFGF